MVWYHIKEQQCYQRIDPVPLYSISILLNLSFKICKLCNQFLKVYEENLLGH